MDGCWGTWRLWVLLEKKGLEEGVFALGQKCAVGVSVFAFVLFWSDKGKRSGFLSS